MGILFVYILKSSFCLAVFYLFYRLLLSRETFHRFNRIALLGILLLSCLLPFVEVSVRRPVEMYQTMMTWEQWLLLTDLAGTETHAVQVQENVLTWIQGLLLVYLFGILFFMLRNIYSLFGLWVLLKSGRREKVSDYVVTVVKAVLIVHERDISPFSWMRYIVISQKDLHENGREILTHELAHIRNRHSWDLFAADICIFFQWFNPAAWLLKQELQNIHEYEADETVINEGVDARQYQLLLIKKAVGTRLYSMANSFNHSKLKKRITMMLKEKSSPWARLKYLYVLPVAAIAVTAFARPEVSETVEEISAVKVNDLTAIVETKVAESSGQLLPVQSVPKDSVNRKSKVAVQQMDELVVVGYASKDSVKDREPVFNVVEQMPSFPGGMEALMQYLAKNMRYPVEAQKNKVQGRVVVGFIVSKDGDIKKAHILRGVDPELDAEAIRVIESMPRWMPGMQRGKAVAVSYTLPVMFRLTGDALGLKLVEASGSTAGELDKGVTFSYAEGKQPLCIVNGKEVDWAVMRALNPDRIKSITVLKDKAILEEKYGEKGQNGVLLITLKGYTE
ncbi:M56 family metallopeptidase [Bacteroides eggerthii]|jgi:TonB family protein|uniref:Gram-negative bacterial TonB protein C-terminal n=1 Tax=Bacteroides eggerthii TaxID=28111 RepID=A0A975KHQ2_9BACE|nr:M56 family metallopeptidase [Bacteroides eggerthii]QUT45920.1 Gram-negative bacterial TonB protein C-terminal [Bacteroides eggerthii]